MPATASLLMGETWYHKHGIITAVLTDTDEFNNYHPITILLIQSKVLERVIVADQLAFLETSDLPSRT